MRATASHTLTVEAACVPPELSYPRAHLDRGTPVASGSACHQVPLEGVSGLTFVAPILGAARGTLNAWIALARRRRSRPGTAVTLSASHDLVLSRASAEVEAASLLVTAVADRADAGARTSLHEVTGARDCAFAAELLVAATDRVVAGAGTAGLSTDHALERLWRDVHSAASHIMLQPARAAGAYARAVLD
jgi:alkylation response protein AidB-like acyl-CoA dehydrogenase